MTIQEIRDQLMEMAEEEYKNFNQKLCPDAGHPLLGVRIPQLRKLARTVAKEDWQSYWENGLEEYQEEILLKGLVLAYAGMPMKDKSPLVREFVPKIDSWAVCDTFCFTLKIKKEDMSAVWNLILPYTCSKREYEVRFGVVMLLRHYITEAYADQVIQVLDGVCHEGYYARMAVAWAFAELGVKFPIRTMAYLKGAHHLDAFTYRKVLQKMRESYRVTSEQKAELKKMGKLI